MMELRSYRDHFHIPNFSGKESIYFNGNSLGLQPKSVQSYIQKELDDWSKWGVEGHENAENPWISYHEIFIEDIKLLVGAKEKEVVVTHSLTTNLHLLLVSFYRPTKKRFKILCEKKAFPSDQYALQSQVELHGLKPKECIVEVALEMARKLLEIKILFQKLMKLEMN